MQYDDHGPGVNDLFNCQVYSVRVAGRLGAPVTLRLNNHRIAWAANPAETPVGTTALDIGSYATVLGPGVVEGYWANIGMSGEPSVLRGVTATNPQSYNLLAAGQHLLIQGNTFKGGARSRGASRWLVGCRNCGQPYRLAAVHSVIARREGHNPTSHPDLGGS